MTTLLAEKLEFSQILSVFRIPVGPFSRFVSSFQNKKKIHKPQTHMALQLFGCYQLYTGLTAIREIKRFLAQQTRKTREHADDDGKDSEYKATPELRSGKSISVERVVAWAVYWLASCAFLVAFPVINWFLFFVPFIEVLMCAGFMLVSALYFDDCAFVLPGLMDRCAEMLSCKVAVCDKDGAPIDPAARANRAVQSLLTTAKNWVQAKWMS